MVSQKPWNQQKFSPSKIKLFRLYSRTKEEFGEAIRSTKVAGKWTAIISSRKEYSKPVYFGHLGTTHKCPDYQGVLVSLYDKSPFGTITKCVDYTGVLIFFEYPNWQVNFAVYELILMFMVLLNTQWYNVYVCVVTIGTVATCWHQGW